MYAFSTGLSRSDKVELHAAPMGPLVHGPGVNSVPLSVVMILGNPPWVFAKCIQDLANASTSTRFPVMRVAIAPGGRIFSL